MHLRTKELQESLISINESYLSQGEILLEVEGTPKGVKIASEVPQGSVLGPTL